MGTFNIRHGILGTDRNGWALVCDSDGNPLEYIDGKTAALAVESLRASEGRREMFGVLEGHSLCVKQEVASAGDENWREREAARFASGQYKPLPWHNDLEARAPDWHFAHIAESDARKVAFTETEEKGRADKQRVMRCAEYLQAYTSFGHDKREYYLAQLFGLNTNVLFATSPDEIEGAYIKMHIQDCGGISSCMTYRASHFNSHCHPVRVYGAGDLALAYLEDSKSNITARALVWPERNRCGRLYGHEASLLRTALRAKGYDTFYNEALVGARLLKIPDGDRDDRFVMPYVDGTYTFADCDGGEYFKIADEGAGYSAARTDGIAYVYEQACCEHCDEHFNADEGTDVNGENWCSSCVENSAFHCHHCGETHHCDNQAEVATGRSRWGFHSEYWCESCVSDSASYSEHHCTYLADNITVSCDHCCETFCDGDLEEVIDSDGAALMACNDCRESIAEAEAEAEADEPILAPVTETATNAAIAAQ